MILRLNLKKNVYFLNPLIVESEVRIEEFPIEGKGPEDLLRGAKMRRLNDL